MHPSREHNTFLSCFLFILARHCQLNTVNPRQSLAQTLALEKLFTSRILTQKRQILLQVRVRIRVAITEKHRVLIMLERVRKSRRVIILRAILVLPDRIPKIPNICARSMPTYLLSLSFFIRVNSNFHAIVEHGVALGIVQNIEFY